MRAMFVILFAAACGRSQDGDCHESFFLDDDGDGHGGTGQWIERCTAGAGYVTTDDDCDDGDAAIHPGVPETCNALDDDCDGLVDNADSDVTGKVQLFLDGDGDGYGVESNTVYACEATGYAPAAGDCDDATATTFPGATEDCANGVDDDCDSRIDDCRHSIDASDSLFIGRSEWLGVGDSVETGDVNADGVADLIATAAHALQYLDFDTARGAYVVFGPMTAGRITPTADVAFRNAPDEGIWLPSASAGDANGDGNDDVLFTTEGEVHGFLFLGPVTSDASVAEADLVLADDDADAAGVALILGDHDGDGRSDIAATAYDHTRNGSVYVVSGAVTGTVHLPADATYTYADQGNDRVGDSIASLGDTTGDGVGDLAIGDPENHAVYVLAGGEPPGSYSMRGAPISKLQSGADDRFGQAIAATDYDSDGYVDILVGAPAEPSVRAFLGPFQDDRDASSEEVRWTGVRGVGYAIAADGDVDADGQPDVLFGNSYGSTEGAVYLQIGTATGVVDVADLVAFTSSSCTGPGVAFVPDWTGDGASEVALGDVCFEPAGRVGVFFSEGL